MVATTVASDRQEAGAFNTMDRFSFMNLTNFYENGRAITTTVWFTVVNGKVYFVKQAKNYKPKRIQSTGQVEISPSDFQGSTLGGVIEAHGRLVDEVTEPELVRQINASFKKKYHVLYGLFNLLTRLQKTERIFVEIFP